MELRKYKEEDAQCLLDWLKDEQTVTLWKADRFVWPVTEEQLKKYDTDFSGENHGRIVTMVDEHGIPAGHFSFRDIDPEKRCAYMGFIVIDPAAKGKGYGKLMVSLGLQYAFDVLQVDTVTLGVYDCNIAARRCYEAVGFREIDRLHRVTDFHGERWEYFYMAVEKGGVQLC